MARLTPDSATISHAIEHLTENGYPDMAHAGTILLNEAMQMERTAFLQAGPSERNPERVGYARGFKPKRVKTRVGELELSVPKTRGQRKDYEPFYPQSLESGLRSERALTLAVAEMYVQGASTRRVTKVVQEVCGLETSSTQVSRASEQLDEVLEAWRMRALDEEYHDLVLDARYEKVRHGEQVRSMAVLVAIGVSAQGKRSVISVSTSLSEAEVHWREFLRGLVQRGLEGVHSITSDDHQGLKAAPKAVFPGVAWQRCQFHLQRNAVAYVRRADMRTKVASDAAPSSMPRTTTRRSDCLRRPWGTTWKQPQAFRVDGSQHPRRLHHPRSSGSPSQTTTDIECRRMPQQRDQAAHARRNALSQRSILTQTRVGCPGRGIR